MANFLPILYDSEEVGRRIKSTKVKHSWMFEIAGKSYTLDYYDSRRSHKAKVSLDGVEVFKGKKSGSDFTIPLRAGRADIVVVQKKDQVDITIGNTFFKHELDRIQRQQIEYDEEEFQDEPQRPAKPQNQYAPRSDEPLRRKPAEPPKPRPAEPPRVVEEPKKPVERPKPVDQPKPPELYPKLPDSKPLKLGDVDLISGLWGDEPKPPAKLPEVIVIASQDDDLMGETIRPAKPQPPPQSAPQPLPSQPLPSQPMSGMQPGMMQPGMMQPGMMQPGMMQPGMMQPGMMQPGMMQPGMMQPGMMQPGMYGQPYGYPGGFPPGYPQAQMFPSGALMPMGQPGMGAIPAVAKDLQLSSPPNLAPGSYATNADREMPNFYTPHIGLIDSNAKIAKNDKFSENPVILAGRNPFVQDLKPADQTYTTDQDIKELVDVDNLADPFYSKPLQKKYDEQVKGVEVPNSDPFMAMKDIPLSEAGAKNPFNTGAQAYMGGPMGGYPQMMYPQGQMQYPAGAMPYGTGPPQYPSSNPFVMK